MIETFFQPDVDKTTGEIFYNTKSKKHLFEDLKIKDASLNYDPVTGQLKETKVLDCLGSFPVISLSFGGDVKDTNEELIGYYSDMLLPTFRKHSYLLNTKGVLVGQGYELFKNFIEHKKLSKFDFARSLDVLIVALNMHYKRRVIVLIDEYDRNLINLASVNSPLYKNALGLIKSLLDPLKLQHQLLQFTIFTGGSKIIKGEMFTGLNHFLHDSINGSNFPEYFGFTETEIDDLFSRAIEIKPELKNMDIKNNVKEMYNGYSIEKKMIYNPWSIMCCLDALNNNREEPYMNFWAGAGSVELIENTLMKLKSTEKIEKLIASGCVNFKYQDGFQLEELASNEKNLLSFLVDSGYLTKTKGDMFKIPNKEVKDYFYDGLLNVWLHKIDVNLDLDKMKAFDMEDCENYTKSFNEDVLEIVNFPPRVPESQFRDLITLPYIASTANKHYYDAEMLTSYGTKVDIVFEPIKDKSNIVILFEFKKTEELGNEIKLFEEAFYQMFEKKYTNHLLNLANKEKNSHWATIYLRAAVFSKDERKNKRILSMHEVQLTRKDLENAIQKFNNENPKENQNPKEKGNLFGKMLKFLEDFKSIQVINS